MPESEKSAGEGGPGRLAAAGGRGARGCFLFFQAEDGIRDYKVTGVQTCALPISTPDAAPASSPARGAIGRGTLIGRGTKRHHRRRGRNTRPLDDRVQGPGRRKFAFHRSEEHTSELQSPCNLVCRLLLEKKKSPRT